MTDPQSPGTRPPPAVTALAPEEMEEMMKKLNISEQTPTETPVIEGGIFPESYFDHETYPTNMNQVCGPRSSSASRSTSPTVRTPTAASTAPSSRFAAPTTSRTRSRSSPSPVSALPAPRPLGITRLRGCDMNMLTEKPVHWCSRPESLPAKAKAKGLKDFFFVYNIVVCAAVAFHRVGHLQEEVHLPLPVPHHPRRPGEHQPHRPQNDPDPPERRRRQVEDQAHQAYPHRR